VTAFIGRREFISLLGGAAAAWPMVAGAQQSAMPVIGYLTGASMTGEAGFKQGLQETGLIEGRHFQIEHRWVPHRRNIHWANSKR
jgi:putative ABC transport system substrate-binding protein